MLRVDRCSSYGHQAVPEAAAFALQEAVVRVQMELKVVIYENGKYPEEREKDDMHTLREEREEVKRQLEFVVSLVFFSLFLIVSGTR